MGRRWKKLPRRNRVNDDKPKNNSGDTRGPGYKDIIKENAAFELYYKAQNIVSEEEWPTFMQCLRTNLPSSFRITGSKSQAKSLLKIIKGEFLNDLVSNTEDTLKPLCLPWYPDNLAWQLNLDRNVIRKSEQYGRLHRFLVSETESGNISRQETVSMIPPILLDVQSHHKVLDMCAAPGSKTAQLIEILHSDESKLPEGMVVANDVDNKRCYMLVHQAKRLQSPCVIITNNDAGVFPNMTLTNEDGSKASLKFDRILCDVPCSGDGTMRKNIDVWTKWNIANGNNMHGLQMRIALRGLELLSIGGKLVYSTCSLNPVEDEAVIQRLLSKAEGAVRLVDVRDRVKGLKITPGLSTWKVMSRDLVLHSKYEDVPEKFHTQIHPQMFPLPPEEVKELHLEKCIRILPHAQDTGGFFVAVLEKTRLLPGEGKVEDVTTEQLTSHVGAPPPKKKRKIFGYKEDPFIFFEKGEQVWEGIRTFYDISDDVDETLFLTRCKEGKKKNIYFTNRSVRNIVLHNQDKLKLINTGVRTFVRCDNKNTVCSFRLAQEAMHTFLGLFKLRKVPVERSDFITLLESDDVNLPPEIRSLHPDTQDRFNSIDTGSVVLLYEEQTDCESPLKIAIVGWKGQSSVRAYIPRNDRIHYLRLMGVDTSRFEFDKFKQKRGSDAKEEEEEEEEGLKEENTEFGESSIDCEEKNQCESMEDHGEKEKEEGETEKT